MSSSSPRGPSRMQWALGSALILATLASLGAVFWASSREPSLETIRRALRGAALG